MDRAAKLAETARLLIDRETAPPGNYEARRDTRDKLAAEAERLGFPPNERSAAIDQALKDAGTTP